MDTKRTPEEVVRIFKMNFLTRFIIESLQDFTDEQLDAIAMQASFELESRSRENSKPQGKG